MCRVWWGIKRRLLTGVGGPRRFQSTELQSEGRCHLKEVEKNESLAILDHRGKAEPILDTAAQVPRDAETFQLRR